MSNELWGLNTLNTFFFVFVCICFDLFIFLEVEHDLVEMLAGGWDLKSDCRSSMTVRHKTLPQKIHQWLAGDLVPVILDVTLESTVQSAYETITKDLEQHALMLVGLVNCAGLSRCKNSTQKTTPRKKSSPAFSRCFNSPGGFCSHPFSKTPFFPRRLPLELESLEVVKDLYEVTWRVRHTEERNFWKHQTGI